MSAALSFTVHGLPAPAGSKKPMRYGTAPVAGPDTRKWGLIDDSKKTGPWKVNVTQVAGAAMAGRALLTGPIEFTVIFYRPRPQAHYRANGELKPNAPRYPTQKPDATKLVRATEDALKGVVWRDDSLVVNQHAYKRYGNARAEVKVEELDG